MRGVHGSPVSGHPFASRGERAHGSNDMRNTLFCAVLGLGCLFLSGARAEDRDKAGQPNDKAFVLKVSESDLAEINLGKLASKQASSAEVKKFAEKMVADHTKTSKELSKLADDKKFTVSQKMDADHEAVHAKLSKLSGSEFDREYMKGQVKAHELAVALFEKQSKDGKDDELKKWAAKTLPDLKMHLKMARKVHDGLKGTGASDR